MGGSYSCYTSYTKWNNFKKTSKTPFELSECLAKVLLREPKKRKIGSKNCDCMFIGYAENSATYRFMVLRSDMLDINKIIESKNA